MYALTNIDSKLTFNTMLESDRNFYFKPQNLAWKALKENKPIEILHQPTETGWSLVFVKIGDVTHQLTKKKIRTSDLKFYFGGG